MQMVACDSAISPMPNSTSSLHWFLPLVTLCTVCPQRQTPDTSLSDSIIPLPHSCYSHCTWLLLHGDSEPWSFQFFLIQLFSGTPSKLPVPAQWHITVLVVQLSPMEKNDDDTVWHHHNSPHCRQWMIFLNHSSEPIISHSKPFYTLECGFVGPLPLAFLSSFNIQHFNLCCLSSCPTSP